MYTVYILNCADDTFHSGVTKNLDDRLAYHKKGENPDAYTFTRLPVQLVYQKAFDRVRDAIAFNQQLQEHPPGILRRIISGELTVVDTSSNHANKNDEPSQKNTVILPSVYLGNLAYFVELKNKQEARLDLTELFQKQTYRSRCTILTANGLLNLVVPVVRPNGKETQMNAVRISYVENWQKGHIKAIESAYRRAPYYEFYAEGLFRILETKYELLIDLNIALTEFILDVFSWNCSIVRAEENEKPTLAVKKKIVPKNRLDFIAEPYHQVFSDEKFEPNLSIIDWLFNQGKL